MRGFICFWLFDVFLCRFKKQTFTWPRMSIKTKVQAAGSKKAPKYWSWDAKGICLTVLAFCLDNLTSQRVIWLLVQTKKLKSSPKQKPKSCKQVAFVNQKRTSSACLCFKKRRVSSVGATWIAKHDFEGCTAIAMISLLLYKRNTKIRGQQKFFDCQNILMMMLIEI